MQESGGGAIPGNAGECTRKRQQSTRSFRSKLIGETIAAIVKGEELPAAATPSWRRSVPIDEPERDLMASASHTTLDALPRFRQAERSGFDFTGYKRSSIERRVGEADGLRSESRRYDDYIDYLELHPEEFAELFNTILINVTSFFRDPQTWEHLAIGGRSRS